MIASFLSYRCAVSRARCNRRRSVGVQLRHGKFSTALLPLASCRRRRVRRGQASLVRLMYLSRVELEAEVRQALHMPAWRRTARQQMLAEQFRKRTRRHSARWYAQRGLDEVQAY